MPEGTHPGLLGPALPAALPPRVSARPAAPGQSDSASMVYPESDGKPMADNTRQMQWIVVLFGNLCALFAEAKDVFVAANLFWYPVEGENENPNAPDVLVVFGRPRGHRKSYRQWEEADIPVTVAFEVLSPNNDYMEMSDKEDFYERHGVEEYYVYDPEKNYLRIFVRQGTTFRKVRPPHGFVSPRLGIRFELSGPELVVSYPDGRRFLTFEELDAQRQAAEQRADKAEQRADKAEQRADKAEQRADTAEQKLLRLAELSRKARHEQASAEELLELERLEDELGPPA